MYFIISFWEWWWVGKECQGLHKFGADWVTMRVMPHFGGDGGAVALCAYWR